VSQNFETVAVIDFEYEAEPGDMLRVLCMVVHVLNESLQHVRTIRWWRDDFGSKPPFDIGPDALIVAYSAWAEMTCFLALGWPFPQYVLDLHTAYLATSNTLAPWDSEEQQKHKKPRKRLSDACRAHGIRGWESVDKDVIAKDIGEGNWRKWGREAVIAYCEEDVAKTVELLRAQLLGAPDLEPIDVPHVIHWSEYSAKAIARIQARGMPIDTYRWNLVQENKAAVIAALLRRFDPSHNTPFPIYTIDGQWSYERFEQWLIYIGAPAWPRLESGRLDIGSDAFRLMFGVIPGIEGLHALRDSLGFIAKARLPIGRDGRNRPSLFPFATATGRNAHRRSPYNAHAGMRSFMLFPQDTIGFHSDWRSQEVGVAAARFDDRTMQEDYLGGDVYHALARLCGLTDERDPVRWKAANPAQRDRMKPLQLGINYGMGVSSLAKGLDRHPLIAAEIIERHKRRYQPFWRGREEAVQETMLRRRIESSFGWPLHITCSPNKRTLYNFPMQSDGAEMLREATVRLCEAGIVPIMLIHDGILFEETDPRKIDEADAIMRAVGRLVCNGLEIGVDTDQPLIGGARYRDKRPVAKAMWDTIMSVLVEVGALPLQEAA
jgi:DNA polymerase-1